MKVAEKFQPVLSLDRRLSNDLRIPPGNHWLWKVGAIFAHSGDSWFWLAGLFIIWIVTFFVKSAWHARAALMAAGILVLAVGVLAIKFKIRRVRPSGSWGEIYRKSDPHSFPSGHAARAAMLAVIALGLGPVWFAILVLAWVPWVSWARVATGLHYLGDVLAGLLVGVTVGILMLLVSPLIMAFLPWAF